MSQTESDQTKERRYRFKQNLIKSDIIDFILRNRNPIQEPKIINFLQEKYGTTDRSTIHKHLHHLEEMECLEWIQPSKKTTRANRWDVTKPKQLVNIRQHFSDIELNRYEKSLNIVSRYRLLHVSPVRNKIFHVQLLLSASFFDIVLKIDIDILYDRAYDIYRFGEGFEDDQLLQNEMDSLYSKLIDKIFTNPTLIRNVWENHIPNLFKTGFNSDSFEYYKIVKISNEIFKKILESIGFQSKGINEEISGWKLMKKASLEISGEIFKIFLKDIPVEFQKNKEKLLDDISDDILNKIMEEYSQELHHKIVKIKNYQQKILYKSPFIIFDYCFGNDILNNIVSPVEKDFVKRKKYLEQKTENIALNLNNSYAKDIKSEIDDYFDDDTKREYMSFETLCDEYLNKYMFPLLETS